MLDLLDQTTVVFRTFFAGVPGKPGDGNGDEPDEDDDGEESSGK